MINPQIGNPNSSYLFQLASMTENLNLQRSLLRNLDEQNAVDIMDNTMVSGIETDTKSDDPLGGSGWPVVTTSTGKTLRARLLVCPDVSKLSSRCIQRRCRLVRTGRILLCADLLGSSRTAGRTTPVPS